MTPHAAKPSMTLAAPAIRTIALAGNPNSGKTTIFNALTGLRQKTGNYPGVTVEKRVGRLRLEYGVRSTEHGGEAEVGGSDSLATPHSVLSTDVIDLPGTYSLISESPDERIAVDVLCGRVEGTAQPDAVVVVVDASNLQRNLYLVSQLIEMRVPMVVALNMTDVAERRGLRVDAAVLAERLGVPVVPVVGHRGTGIDRLKRAIPLAAVPREPDWPLPAVLKSAVRELATYVDDYAAQAMLSPVALAERLIVGEPVGVTLPADVEASAEAKRATVRRAGIDPMQADVEAHYAWIEELSAAVTAPSVDVRVRGAARSMGGTPMPHGRDAHATDDSPAASGLTASLAPTLDDASKPPLSDRVDRVLLHKVWGLLAFVAIMTGIFMAIFFAAAPLMDATEAGIGWLGGLVSGLLPEGTLKDLWNDGIVAGVGGVLVFVPQIAILFGLLAILEDSGYLARAAFLMDRLLGSVGLSGKAFVPLLSGFACAIPGVMAARTIASPRDRLRTIFVLPFMSCSARLPVYALLIAAFFASYAWWVQGGIMLGLYLLGIAAAFVTAWVWKRRDGQTATSSFLMELPSYKVPQFASVLRVMGTNTWAFVSRAGTIIFALSIILWALTYWPQLSDERRAQIAAATPAASSEQGTVVAQAAASEASEAKPVTSPNAGLTATQLIPDSAALSPEAETAIASEQLRQSLAGRFGHLIEPVIRPLGFDWKMGVGMVGAFGAREVFVSTMGIVYAAGDAEENPVPLEDAMKADAYPDGRPVWTPLIALNMLIWFVLAMQCLSTVAIVKRETGGWRWPLVQLAYMNGLAYALCLVVYQVGRALGG